MCCGRIQSAGCMYACGQVLKMHVAKAAEEVDKDAWYNKRAIIPAGTLVPVAFEMYGTLGAYLRDVVRNYVRPVTCTHGSTHLRTRVPSSSTTVPWALLHLPAETP